MKEIKFNSETRYLGVFTYLQRKYHTKNITSIGKVNVTSSDSLYGLRYDSKNNEWPIITKDDRDTFWLTNTGDSKYYIVDLKDNLLALKSYEYKTYFHDVFAEWFMSGSIDGINYEAIHYQTNYSINSTSFVYDYFIVNTSLKAYRFFKLEPVGKTIKGRNSFAIHRLEFYGYFYDMHMIRCTQKLSNRLFYNLIFYVISLYIS